MKVLLVEDNYQLANISVRILQSLGHQVEHAASGQAAWSLGTKWIPDIVLLDLSLPDMHGYRLARQMRGDARFNDTIVVALTGFRLTGDSAQSKAAGIDAHFRKPMDFAELELLKRDRGNDSAAAPDRVVTPAIERGP
jgi:CheY-like chemotaxis protein